MSTNGRRYMYYCDKCKLAFRPESVQERYGILYHKADRFSRVLGAFGHLVRRIGSDSVGTLDTPTPDAVASELRLLDKSGRVGSADEGSSVQLEPSLALSASHVEYTWSLVNGTIYTDRQECVDAADGGPIFERRVYVGPWSRL